MPTRARVPACFSAPARVASAMSPRGARSTKQRRSSGRSSDGGANTLMDDISVAFDGLGGKSDPLCCRRVWLGGAGKATARVSAPGSKRHWMISLKSKKVGATDCASEATALGEQDRKTIRAMSVRLVLSRTLIRRAAPVRGSWPRPLAEDRWLAGRRPKNGPSIYVQLRCQRLAASLQRAVAVSAPCDVQPVRCSPLLV